MDDTYKEILNQCLGFDWDRGDIDKNWLKHEVSPAECEQFFFNRPLVIQDGIAHSETERRFFALGKTDTNRTLFLVFTVRKNILKSDVIPATIQTFDPGPTGFPKRQPPHSLR